LGNVSCLLICLNFDMVKILFLLTPKKEFAMAIICFVRDGSPPNNIAYSEIKTVEEIIENFGNYTMKFIGNFDDNIPIINEKSGPSTYYAAPKYVVVKIEHEDLKDKRFPELGFYLIEGLGPPA